MLQKLGEYHPQRNNFLQLTPIMQKTVVFSCRPKNFVKHRNFLGPWAWRSQHYDNARATMPYRLQSHSSQTNRAMLHRGKRRFVIANISRYISERWEMQDRKVAQDNCFSSWAATQRGFQFFGVAWRKLYVRTHFPRQSNTVLWCAHLAMKPVCCSWGRIHVVPPARMRHVSVSKLPSRRPRRLLNHFISHFH